MSLTVGSIHGIVISTFFTSLSGMVSGVKRAKRGVSCCVVSYFYIAFFSVLAFASTALAVLLADGLLEVRRAVFVCSCVCVFRCFTASRYSGDKVHKHTDTQTHKDTRMHTHIPVQTRTYPCTDLPPSDVLICCFSASRYTGCIVRAHKHTHTHIHRHTFTFCCFTAHAKSAYT